jgi:ribosome-associated toxin RatA of RatAB toxin-antitoxin module
LPAYGECHSTDIAASPEQCYAALTDFEHLPDWQGAVREARVVERDDEGRGAVVEYVIDAKLKRVRYTLRQVHDPPGRLGCEYLRGDFRDFSGEWRFTPRDGGAATHVELDLHVDPGRLIPRPVRAAISDAVMRRALGDLKSHLER